MVSISRLEPSGYPFRCSAGLFVVGLAVAVAGCTSASLSTPDQTVNKCQVTLTAPQAMVAGAGGSGTVAVAAAAECAWTASTDATWITDLNPKSGQGAGSVQFTAAANPARATREADISVNGTLARIRQDVGACTFTVTPTALTISSTGGPGSFTVTTLTGCAWTVSSQIPWITITSAANNDGSGTVTFNAAANTTGVTRTGSLTIAGQTVSVTQTTVACTYTVAPLNQSVAETGGAANPITVTTASPCTWTAASNDAWLTVATGASGTGNGTVQVNVGANSGATRAGTLTIAGQTVTITQTAAGCSYNVSPLNPPNVGVNGGAVATITVTTASHCAWTAVSNNTAFLQVTSGASGTGTGTVQSTMSANTGAGRTGTMAIAGSTVTVNQDACSYTLGSSSVTIPFGGANGNTVSVTTNGTSCQWTASESLSWVNVTSPTSSATSSGTVTFDVDPNTGPSRSGVITIAGQSFTVNQDALICNNSISPTSETVVVSAGTGTSITVTTSVQACTWTATSNASWMTVTSGTPGTGNGTVGWTFAGNTGAQRSGTMTIAGQTFTATQEACTYSLSASSTPPIPATGGSGNTVNVTTNGTASCQWTASTADSWLTIDSPTGTATGNGTVSFTVAANNTGTARTGTISIAGQTFTVNQNP